MSYPIVIEEHYGIHVLRDDKLIGGTKSILMNTIDQPDINEFVYASPVYGGFQIALSAYCQRIGKKTTIFCARRKQKHANTMKCIQYGANIVEIPYGYLRVVEKYAREYCQGKTGVKKIVFGANSQVNLEIIAQRVHNVLQQFHLFPDEIWCAVGSGTLLSSILMAVPKEVKVYGVQVGAAFHEKIPYPNLTIIPYPKSFDKESHIQIDFPSTANYDRKAFEICLQKYQQDPIKKTILFWNVL